MGRVGEQCVTGSRAGGNTARAPRAALQYRGATSLLSDAGRGLAIVELFAANGAPNGPPVGDAEVENGQPAGPHTPESHPAHGADSGPGANAAVRGRVLLVDPETRWLEPLARWLRLEGYAVTTAQEGRAALAAIAEQTWDLLFVHVDLPDLSYRRLAKLLRRRSRSAYVVLIGGDQRAAEQVGGGCAALPRPWKSSELVRVLLLASSHALGDTTARATALETPP